MDAARIAAIVVASGNATRPEDSSSTDPQPTLWELSVLIIAMVVNESSTFKQSE